MTATWGDDCTASRSPDEAPAKPPKPKTGAIRQGAARRPSRTRSFQRIVLPPGGRATGWLIACVPSAAERQQRQGRQQPTLEELAAHPRNPPK